MPTLLQSSRGLNIDFMTLQQLCNDTRQRLTPLYGEREARWLVRTIMEELKGYSQVDLVCKAQNDVTDWLAGHVREVTDRLLSHEPIQYIFSQATFYGLKFKVTPATLIPRPETEEMVDLIVNEFSSRSDLRVLDACTGSGCIAVALARNLPFARVDAFDLSDDALAVAEENGRNLNVKIDFFKADALKLTAEREHVYDIIVSNPPYIARSEAASMDRNVLDFEPHSALFVPDSNPLEFYLALSQYAWSAIKPSGKLYYEINPLFADDLKRRLVSSGWNDVEIQLDAQGKKRFLTAQKTD